MKKFKQILMLVVFTTFSLVSCNNDDDGGNASIEGKWELSKEGPVVSGQEELEDFVPDAGCSKDYDEIKAGGIGTSYYFEDNGSGCETYSNEFTWSREGNTVTITFGSDSYSAEILQLTSSTLKLKTEEQGQVYITVYKRI